MGLDLELLFLPIFNPLRDWNEHFGASYCNDTGFQSAKLQAETINLEAVQAE